MSDGGWLCQEASCPNATLALINSCFTPSLVWQFFSYLSMDRNTEDKMYFMRAIALPTRPLSLAWH